MPEHRTSLISIETMSELNTVLRRPQFSRYLTEEESQAFLATVVRESELVEATAAVSVCRDPSDDKFLEMAVSGRAAHIISGDEDLLALHPFRGIEILTPMDFITQQTSPV